jgi:hypothetical protein
MDTTPVTDSSEHGFFRYFYELVIGAVLTAFIGFQAWLATMQIRHGHRLTKLEAERLTRSDFDIWKEEQQLQLDELRASTIASNNECVRAVERSQDKLEANVVRALDRVENSNQQLLVALAKRGLEQA